MSVLIVRRSACGRSRDRVSSGRGKIVPGGGICNRGRGLLSVHEGHALTNLCGRGDCPDHVHFNPLLPHPGIPGTVRVHNIGCPYVQISSPLRSCFSRGRENRVRSGRERPTRSGGRADHVGTCEQGCWETCHDPLKIPDLEGLWGTTLSTRLYERRYPEVPGVLKPYGGYILTKAMVW